MRLPIIGLPQSLRQDTLAGFTVAMVAIPQSMAYAAIAGVGPINGLYTAIFPAIVGALFGQSSHLVSGPTNATALVTADVLSTYAGQASYLDLVFALAILSGLIKLALGLFRLGWIIRFVSNSVLTGFLTGAAILIILSQVSSLLGLARSPHNDTVNILRDVLLDLPHVSLPVLVTGVATIVLLLALKRLNRKLPAELLAIGVVGGCVRLLGWHSHGVRLVSDMGMLHDVSLMPHLPALTLADWQILLPSAGAVAIFSLVEAMSIAKSVAVSAGETVNPSREFAAQGLASLAGGLMRGMPSSGSLARTAINYVSGGRTRLSAVLSGVAVLLALVAFGGLLSYIPVASLAGVVVVSAYNLINRHQIRLTWQSQPASRVVMAATFAATLMLPLHFAIYIGAILSIGVYVHESSKLQLTYLTRAPDGGFVEHSLEEILRVAPSIVIVNVEGMLSFGAAEDLEQRVNDIIRSGVRVVILRLRRVHALSSTGVSALERIVLYANRAGTRVLICGVHDEVEATLDSSGITSLIGAERLFRASNVLFASTQQALARAEEIVLAERTHGD